MRLRILLPFLLACCSIAGYAAAAEIAPPPRPVPPPVASVLIPDEGTGEPAAKLVFLGRVAARVATEPVSVLIPDDAAIREASASGLPVTPDAVPLRKVMLGRVTAADPVKAVPLGKYLTPARGPPASVDYGAKAGVSLKRMYLNDRYGCCVISSVYHGIGVWTGNDSPTCQVVSDATIKSVYDKLKAGIGDSGCVISDVLSYGVTTGYPLADGSRAKLDGFVAVGNSDKTLVMSWIYLFGGGPVGVDLPRAWTKGGDGSTWDVPAAGTDAEILGGHDVRAVGYTDAGVVVSTWGGTRTITWRAFTSTAWVKEMYAPLSPLWYGADNLAPNGVDVAGLKKALATANPNVDPVIPPPPPLAGFSGVLTYRDGVLVGVTSNPKP